MESASLVECLAKYFMRSMGSSRIYASSRESAPPSWKKPRGFPNRRLFALRFVPTWQRLNVRLLFDVVRGFDGILTSIFSYRVQWSSICCV